MRFQLLGPVVLQPRTPTATKVRTLLATFLIQAGKVVSTEALIDELWGDEPPRTVTTTVQVYTSQLRTLLSDGEGSARHSVLQTQPPGYRLNVKAHELDLTRFEMLSADGRRAYQRGEYEEARSFLREALGLWRGAALSGIPHGPLLSAAAVHLEEARLTALGQRISSELRLGLHSELTAELLALAAEHPYREAIHAHLMVALYRSERQSDALQAFRSIRRCLIDELGIEPGIDLTRLHTRILRSDPSLAWQRQSAATNRAPVFWLPPAVHELVGRDRSLDIAERLLDKEPETGMMRVLALSGRSGVGKTALAVELARRHTERFPAGQVLVRLRGQDGEPLKPAGVAMAVLRRIESSRMLVESGVHEDADALRELGRVIRGRRLLLVLDDVVSEDQVQPVAGILDEGLLITTSRRALLGLDDAKHLTLDVLNAAQSKQLLTSVVGARVMEDPQATAEIVRLCGRLPLALRVAGGALEARPHWSAALLAERLADEHGPLDLLTAGDLDVRASLLVGYHDEGEAEQRALRLLSLAPETGFSLWTATALLQTTPRAAEQLVQRLIEARLLEVLSPGHQGEHRYGYHRLLYVLAQEQLTLTETDRERDAAADSLAATYLSLARYAGGLMLPGDRRVASRPAATTATAGIAGRSAAHSSTEVDPRQVIGSAPARWFQEESDGLLAAIRGAHRAERWHLVSELSAALSGYMEAAARSREWAAVLTLALDAAERSGDDLARARALASLGDFAWQQRRILDAAQHHGAALSIFEQLGDSIGMAHCLIGAGDTALSEDDAQRAAGHFTAALALRAADASADVPRSAAGRGVRSGLNHEDMDRFAVDREALNARRGLALVDLMNGRAEDALQGLQEFCRAAEQLGDQRWSRFGRRSVERILEHPVDWYGGNRLLGPAEIEIRPGVWLLRTPTGARM